ncbi:50S ribosomal protein L25/general stress protein Ctc [Plebeiibacterium marinum]|uniref:Large ribosomal subunit protein bL25 n=1 Tax=Plebeiibacterium marinum TaxID=2992111 RepID=A0AAE3MFA7_9BACT|nr:50S ribosomal protein L25/general stress protein Ctc [Plebeiobacterium marinum]MCW3806520.1 50S ribosomal protein L25/general stress protein Ctc [Plebeiobacterium marinum]
MQKIELKSSKREVIGKKAAKALRKEEMVPGVLYGGNEVVHFAIEEKQLKGLIYTPNVYIVKLDVEGTEVEAIMQDIQFHPVTDRVLHIDFLQIFEDKPVVIEIPVKLEGFAEGVKAGGRLTLEQRKLRVKGLPANLPDTLSVKIDHLKLGESVQVGELSFDNLELLNAKNSTVAAVKLTRAARAAAQQAKE